MMNATGLSAQDLDMIRSVLARHAETSEAVLFGSRAKGVAAPASDVDLALLGTDNALVAESIASELDELPLPYRFDVQPYGAITSPSLREHIERVGVRI